MSEYVISVQLQRKINAIKAADVKAKKAVFEIAYALEELADEQNFMLADAGYKDNVEQEEPEQIPCLTLPVFQILINIVNPITDDFCTVTDPEPETAMDIFREFFHGTGYTMHWLTDPEDDEIIGAEMRDSSGNLLYSTNQEV